MLLRREKRFIREIYRAVLQHLNIDVTLNATPDTGRIRIGSPTPLSFQSIRCNRLIRYLG
jgi:hypothetical protein